VNNSKANVACFREVVKHRNVDNECLDVIKDRCGGDPECMKEIEKHRSASRSQETGPRP
jgi:hypothetical protein